MVVALLMPSLLVLSRTGIYPAVRLTIAGTGILPAGAWLAERTTLLAGNPLNRVTDTLAAHPFVVAGTLAATAAAGWADPRLRTQPRSGESGLQGHPAGCP